MIPEVEQFVDDERKWANGWIEKEVFRPYLVQQEIIRRQAAVVGKEVRSREGFLTSMHVRQMESVKILKDAVNYRVTSVAAAASTLLNHHSQARFRRGLLAGATFAAQQLAPHLDGLERVDLANQLYRRTILQEPKLESSSDVAKGLAIVEKSRRIGPILGELLEDRLAEAVSISAGTLSDERVDEIVDETLATGGAWFLGMFMLALWSFLTDGILEFGNLNTDWIRGWMWYAQLDNRTCISCVYLHGKIFSNDTFFHDHPHGRCVPYPVVLGTPMYGEDLAGFTLGGARIKPVNVGITGEDWFAALSEQEKEEMIGTAHYRAYTDGAVTLEDLSEIYNHEIYGQIRRKASLRKVLGHKAERYYRRARSAKRRG